MNEYLLNISQRGDLVLSSPIHKVHGRTLVLFGLTFPGHLQERPQDAPVSMGRLLLTIEGALQENLDAHKRWVSLCTAPSLDPVTVDVLSIQEKVNIITDHFHGGDGGHGAWPAGGGGGGGNGPLGSWGGRGADGAALLFEYGCDDQLIDVEAFVLPGTFDWKVPPGVVTVKTILFGGGGGGGGGGSAFIWAEAGRT